VPLYEYQCRSCKKVTEVRHGFKETFDEACPACGGAVARVFSPAPILFKGSGFYVTDSRKSGESATSANGPAKTEGAPAAPTAAEGSSAPAATTAPATPAPSTSTNSSGTAA
jgi:putative FmdB family regulatory protein